MKVCILVKNWQLQGTFEDEKLKAFIPWTSQSSAAYQLLPTVIREQTLDTGVKDILYEEEAIVYLLLSPWNNSFLSSVCFGVFLCVFTFLHDTENAKTRDI